RRGLCELSRAGGQDASDVPGKLITDGVVPELSQRAGKIPAAQRRSLQYALPAACRQQPGEVRRSELYQSGGVGERHIEEVSLAHHARYNQLLHLPPVTWNQNGSECLRRTKRIQT